MAVRVRTDYILIEHTDIHPEELWAPGHTVYNWCLEIGDELKAAAELWCPHDGINSEARHHRIGTGNLLRSIYAHGSRTGPESYDFEYGASAHYAAWVHGGTAFDGDGYIYSRRGFANRLNIAAYLDSGGRVPGLKHTIPVKGPRGGKSTFRSQRGWYMRLPPGGGYTWPLHLRVRGQHANPFLYKAYRTVYHRHEGLPSDLTFNVPIPLTGGHPLP